MSRAAIAHRSFASGGSTCLWCARRSLRYVETGAQGSEPIPPVLVQVRGIRLRIRWRLASLARRARGSACLKLGVRRIGVAYDPPARSRRGLGPSRSRPLHRLRRHPGRGRQRGERPARPARHGRRGGMMERMRLWHRGVGLVVRGRRLIGRRRRALRSARVFPLSARRAGREALVQCAWCTWRAGGHRPAFAQALQWVALGRRGRMRCAQGARAIASECVPRRRIVARLRAPDTRYGCET